MLYQESLWISEQIKKILPENPFPVINLGSSTKKYRQITQSFMQKNIFDLIENEKENVIHIDMKEDEGVDLAGNLYDKNFQEKLKTYKAKLILCNNLLMYLEKDLREELSQILYDILEKDGYLIVTNSYIFPPAHDPVEAYYRDSSKEMYKNLFSKFQLLEASEIEAHYTFYRFLKSKPKVFLVKIALLFMPFYKFREWKFMLNYYLKNFNKNYAAACLFLKK